MDIDGIQTFVAIAELGGFTRAGRRLHRTQPAISRRLNILEHELGAPLFERIRGNARLTEAGRTFLPHAEAALAALKDGQEAVRGLQGGMHGVVSLALVGTLADTTSSMCGAGSRGVQSSPAAQALLGLLTGGSVK
jgi:DNA-binding transcriptional LysR family regulator